MKRNIALAILKHSFVNYRKNVNTNSKNIMFDLIDILYLSDALSYKEYDNLLETVGMLWKEKYEIEFYKTLR